MGAATRILKELAVVTIALVITGVLIAQAEHRIYGAEGLYGQYNVQRGNETSSRTSFLGLKESLHSLEDYLNYSIAVFKNEKGKQIEKKTENGVYRFYIPSPREKFMHMYGTTPQHAILLTFTVLSLSMVLIFLAGLYWGVHAGYKRGWSDRILSALAPVFSGIPGWFWAILLMWLLWWRLDLSTINYIDYIKHAQGMKRLGITTYLNALLLPVATLTLSNIVVYAFNVRNLIVRESGSEHVLVDILKGLPERRIMKKLLRTVLPSFLTFTSYNFLGLMINAMAVEYLFSVPGIGYVFARSVKTVYFFTPTGAMHRYIFFNGKGLFFVALVMGLFYFLNSALMEVLYLRLDPRVRHDVGEG
ncbi:ABC transporter permease [Thermococcus sp. Bubb.Bath]|nr:ABC transporter permease [Thermococcus sp. Bubb.Bath]